MVQTEKTMTRILTWSLAVVDSNLYTGKNRIVYQFTSSVKCVPRIKYLSEKYICHCYK